MNQIYTPNTQVETYINSVKPLVISESERQGLNDDLITLLGEVKPEIKKCRDPEALVNMFGKDIADTLLLDISRNITD